MQFGPRQIALSGARSRRLDQLLVMGGLGLLKKLQRLLCCRDLCLLRSTEKLMSLDQAISVTSLDLGLGLLHKIARHWVLRVERGKLRLEFLVLIGDLGQF